MKTMTARYAGKCAACGEPIVSGQQIKFFGRGHAEHQFCGIAAPAERKPDAPCWICQAPGFFRARGAATPVWCDACNANQSAGDIRTGTTVILNGRRDNDEHDEEWDLSRWPVSRTGDIYKRRCEDAPCCGCCS